MFLLVEDFFAHQLSLSWPRMKENLLLNSLEFLTVLGLISVKMPLSTPPPGPRPAPA
jgi:hypothetical protein